MINLLYFILKKFDSIYRRVIITGDVFLLVECFTQKRETELKGVAIKSSLTCLQKN